MFKYIQNTSCLPKVIILAEAEAEGEGGKTLALEVEAKAQCSIFHMNVTALSVKDNQI